MIPAQIQCYEIVKPLEQMISNGPQLITAQMQICKIAQRKVLRYINYRKLPKYRDGRMKKLLIVESPAKIKTIKKFLGPEFNIVSTMGHIKDLPTKSMGVTRNPITIEYVVIDNKEKTITQLKKAAASVSEVYLAPDPDREGEIIAWHAAQEIKHTMKNSNKVYRITFNEITKSAIVDAINKPSKIDMKKIAAQQARRILDRWVGYEVSPILWKKITKGLSAGRVQSVALKLICDREQIIRNFTPEEYWSIIGTFKHASGTIVAPLTQINKKKASIKNKKEADTLVDELKQASFSITAIEDKKRTKKPLPPFMTSTLQQAAYNRLGFSVKKTMHIAQNLYEGVPLKNGSQTALITYMRTDSLRLSETAIKQTRAHITSTYGDPYLPHKSITYTKKSKQNVQDAHEAIRPIDIKNIPNEVKSYLSSDQAKLYELIWKRTVACQMNPAQYAQRQVTIESTKYLFRVTGSTLIFDGFLKVYEIEADDEDKEKQVKLPAHIKTHDALATKKIDPKQHFTQPPPRYTEASLVKELEKEGIGRPSTYATILSTIRTRSYTTLEKKKFIPTELGMAVTKMLTENLPHIMDLKFTAHMEEDLDKIATGDLERDALLNNFYKEFEKELKNFGDGTKKEPKKIDLACPLCKKALVIRFGKVGEFVGCSDFPECQFTSNFNRDTESNEITLIEKEEPKMLDISCPQCDKQLRTMQGRYGPFTSCSGYPECKYIHQKKASFLCPKDKGNIVERKWRGGTMWGCDNYPKCKYALFGDIEETPCPKCKAPALLKKITSGGKTTLVCPERNCEYKK